MSRPLVFRSLIVLVICLVVLAGLVVSHGVSRPPPALTNATPDEVSRVAIAYTTSHYQMLATPQVLLNRPPSKAEVTTLGLGDLTMNTIEQPPLTLVILKGDFGYGSNPGSADPALLASRRFQYIGYVFDRWAGVPMLAIASPDGGIFRGALNDSALPLVPPVPTAPPLPTPVHPLQHGDIALTVTVPTVFADPQP